MAAGALGMARCMNDCAMNLPEPHSTTTTTAEAGADATPRVPDYKPRDRLDPKWRPGTSVRAKMASRSGGELVDDPWMYSQRSLREHRRLLPAQRIMLGLLLATGVAAAGLVGLSMRGPDEGQRWSAPSTQAAMNVGMNQPALRPAPDLAPIPVDAQEAGPELVKSPAHRTATHLMHKDKDAAGVRTPAAVAGGATPGPDAHAGTRPAPVLPVTPVLAEQVPAAVVAQVQANLVPPAVPSGGDNAGRARRPRTEASGVACSEAQQAMQLCGIGEGARR